MTTFRVRSCVACGVTIQRSGPVPVFLCTECRYGEGGSAARLAYANALEYDAERSARIERYTERAVLHLPLFDRCFLAEKQA